MVRCLIFAMFLCLFAPWAFADDELDDKEWNRWTTESFTVMSVSPEQGEWVFENVESWKTQLVTRWGFDDFKFPAECRVMCVPDAAMMKTLFGTEVSDCQVQDIDGKRVVCVWIVMDSKSDVSQLLSEAILHEMEIQRGSSFGQWANRGIPLLAADVSVVRSRIEELGADFKADKESFFPNALFRVTSEDYEKFSEEQKRMFDTSSAVLVLMLRKEFGEAKLQGFLRLSQANGTEKTFSSIYGFKGMDAFDRSFRRYVFDLSADVKAGKTPDSYLLVERVQR